MDQKHHDERQSAVKATNPFRNQHPVDVDNTTSFRNHMAESILNSWEPIAPVTALHSHPIQAPNTSQLCEAPPPSTEQKRSSIHSDDSEDWNDERTETKNPPEVPQIHVVSPVEEEQSAWDTPLTTSQVPNASTQEELVKQVGTISLEPDGSPVDPSESNANDTSMKQDAAAPPLPPRRENGKAVATFEPPPLAQINERLKETYEIKKIRWQDVTTQSNPRISPILVQNANGPCPLLALVNALTLSTPAGLETALVERLRSREQISLEFLLDAVIDELMSGRRDIAGDLPDPSELYHFLITLHTGMNVNPRFISSALSDSPIEPRNTTCDVPPSSTEYTVPGTFERTREMKLYGIFSIPLIHGWLPLPGSSAYTALSRSAKSYEDAQNIMFKEEELEKKISEGHLDLEEQATLEDISTIKAFLSSNPTQLTTNGLEIITRSISPASVAILFRNDHFSTLYRHPESMQLFQLVTDMGYAGHDEVVWQSLVDVNGENCEFFSGDFRIVGENSEGHSAEEEWTTVQGRSKNKGQSTGRNSGQQYNQPPRSPPGRGSARPSLTEQEDHDLALALQLQEEEEQKERDDVARRKRETEYSERFIEQQAGNGANIPVSTRGAFGRGKRVPNSRNRTASGASNSGTQTSGVTSSPAGRGRGSNASTTSLTPSSPRPAAPPRRAGAPSSRVSSASATRPSPAAARPADPEAGEDAPPPSYEEASSTAAYNPPVNHPAHPSANPVVAQAAAQNHPNASPSAAAALRRTGNFSQANGNVVYGGRGGGAVGAQQQQGVKQGKESCLVM